MICVHTMHALLVRSHFDLPKLHCITFMYDLGDIVSTKLRDHARQLFLCQDLFLSITISDDRMI